MSVMIGYDSRDSCSILLFIIPSVQFTDYSSKLLWMLVAGLNSIFFKSVFSAIQKLKAGNLRSIQVEQLIINNDLNLFHF